ncbi:carbohydrate deacetylase, partial [Candidatus Riflebacteria bacterium]
MRLIIHADDFGLTRGITDNILEAYDSGTLHRTSIIPNGHAFDYAMGEFFKRKNLKLSIHLNFIEGKALCSPHEIPLLVDKNGNFCHGFLSLVMKYFFSTSQIRNSLKRQIKKEMRSQLQKVLEAYPQWHTISIDSHQYLHLLPFVFIVLLELRKEFPISFIRIAREPFFLCLESFHDLKNYLGSNLIKHLLLNFLSILARKKLKKAGIKYYEWLIGIIFTGNQRCKAVETALMKIKERDIKGSAEVLFHPGGAISGEEGFWDSQS